MGPTETASTTLSDRVRDLLAALRAAAKRGAAFHTAKLLRSSDLAARFEGYAEDLAVLDEAAWSALKSAAAQCSARMSPRHLEPLFHLLNEAKGYRYLASLGCTEIAFVTASYDRKTPDLRATLNGRAVICEVKTLNMRDEEPSVFLAGKFTKIVAEAKAQLDACAADARQIVYIVLNGGNGDVMSVLKTATFAGIQVEICQDHASISK